jgi:hypothetical protein
MSRRYARPGFNISYLILLPFISQRWASPTLALTKMNWNSTDFDELFPITLRAAKQVGSILKYLEEVSDDDIKQFYRFYM